MSWAQKAADQALAKGREEAGVSDVIEQLTRLCAEAFEIPTDWSKSRINAGTSSLVYWQDWIEEDRVKWEYLRDVLLGFYDSGSAGRCRLPALRTVKLRYRDMMRRMREYADGRKTPICEVCGNSGGVYVPLYRTDEKHHWRLAKNMGIGPYWTAHAAVPCRCGAGDIMAANIPTMRDVRHVRDAFDHRCTSAGYWAWEAKCRALRVEAKDEPAETAKPGPIADAVDTVLDRFEDDDGYASF